MARTAFPLAITVVGLLAVGASAQEPPEFQLPPGGFPVSTDSAANQNLADTIAGALRSSGLINGANVSIVAMDGGVELRGSARDPQQRDLIGQAVGSLPGVGGVSNQLVVAAPTTAPVAGVPAATAHGHGVPPAGFVGSDPVPLNPPAYPQYDLNPPNMPPYAWPTYAPHNNFSRVAYPTKYPYNAWPYIGPFYPFPKVPLGWRKVTLEWEDGHWWYGRNAVPHDYWRVRFW